MNASSATTPHTSDRVEDSISVLLSLHASAGHQRAATSETDPCILKMRGCGWPLGVLPELRSCMYQIPESPAGGDS